MIMLAAGGIGITPVLGMLKDIYDVGLTREQRLASTPHAINAIYLLWVMPHMDDYDCFKTEMDMCVAASQTPDKPKLVMMVYITRSKEKLTYPFTAGRPDIGSLFSGVLDNHKPEEAGLVFACGPQALVSEMWDKSIQHTMKGRLVDFHHEIFDF